MSSIHQHPCQFFRSKVELCLLERCKDNRHQTSRCWDKFWPRRIADLLIKANMKYLNKEL